MGPLHGIRILDLTTVLMGPYATSILGDMGADVIKVESLSGDIVRRVGPSRSGEMGGLFFHANRSKRSIAIDLKATAGRNVILELATGSDVLIYNMRPQAMAKLGLDYEALAVANPRIIYVGTFGFGQDGPYAARPAYDDLIQGASGVSALLGESADKVPGYVPVNIADRIVGLHAANTILAALHHRSRMDRGQKIDIPMFETMVSFVMGDHMGGLSYHPPLDKGGYARLTARNRRPFRTADGYVCALLYTDVHWRKFWKIIGREPEGDGRVSDYRSRMDHIEDLYADLSEAFAKRTTAEWLETLGAADIPCAPFHNLESVMEDPHLNAVGFFEKVIHPTEGQMHSMRVSSRWTDSQPRPSRLAPTLGEHTFEILAEIGYDEMRMKQLEADGVVRAG